MGTAQTAQTGECQKVVVRTADGREYVIGKPSSPLFKLRVFLYRVKRRIDEWRM